MPETSLKRALITGASGTVGRPLVRALRSRGVETIAWDRAQVAVDDYWGMADHDNHIRPGGPG
ncbi:MAG: NAD-dependent epimerase/dehydratase family protein, partial [Myxococcota bacterium]